MSDASRCEHPWMPAYERSVIGDDDIRALRKRWEADGPQGAYSVRMAERALAGDVSAINACKFALYEAERP